MKRIVIIGASSGLGRLIAEIYIRRGWRVGIAARRVAQLEGIRAMAPGQVEAAEIDISLPDAADRLAALCDRLGGMDIFLQVAGVGFANPDLVADKELQIATVNSVGFTRMVDFAFNYFASRATGGQIAAISSIAGTRGLGFAPAYSASKRYQSTYLDALRQLSAMRHLGITVTDIRPGFIDTDLLDKGRRYPMLMNPSGAAVKIVRAIDRHRRTAIIDWRWWIVVALWRLIPPRLWTHLPVKL